MQDYTHSTAPNRRFPDVVTQRLWKAWLAARPQPYTEDALNAIQQAINVGQGDRRPGAAAEPVPTPPSDDLLKETPATAEVETQPPRRAANDDRAGLGQMLQALHRRPRRIVCCIRPSPSCRAPL